MNSESKINKIKANKIKDYLNSHPQDFAKYVLPSINGMPTIDDVKYDSSYVDCDGIYDALFDAEIIDTDDDFDDIVEEAINEFYDNFKFVSIKIIDVFKSIYEIKYSFRETEYSITGILYTEEPEFIPIEECDWRILSQFLNKTKCLENE